MVLCLNSRLETNLLLLSVITIILSSHSIQNNLKYEDKPVVVSDTRACVCVQVWINNDTVVSTFVYVFVTAINETAHKCKEV